VAVGWRVGRLTVGGAVGGGVTGMDGLQALRTSTAHQRSPL
jgi:hypothetical protein